MVPYNKYKEIESDNTPATAGIYLILLTYNAPTGAYEIPATAGIYLILLTGFAEKAFTIFIHPYHITFEHF